ncbi:MAG TPA: M28 family peptidase [Planctomycetaceae bacterium]|nr:M28 family peptidase [Planctomycetaceae bacterium]
MSRTRRRLVFCALWLVAIGCARPLSAAPPALDAARAFGYLQKICRIGPRPSGSHGMSEQQTLLAEHFSRLGAQVGYQSFDAADPLSGKPVRMSNLIVTWHPKMTERVLLACHYDTRPFPDRDRRNPRGIFVGANDGASGVALLMELGNHMQDLPVTRGVDFIFFDGEELVIQDKGTFFLGSTYFAQQYRDAPPPYRYAAGVLLDMVGDRDLDLFPEKTSLRLAPGVTRGIWAAAKSLKIREFHATPRHEVSDDHIPLNEIARIPTCDIIDFDYPYWHTAQDVPSHCSGESLVKVGRVLVRWIALPPEKQSPPQ